MTYRFLIFDGSYLARSSFECGNLAKGFIARLLSLRDDYDPKLVVVAWDSYADQERIKIYPEYKAERRKKNALWPERERYDAELAELKEALVFLGLDQYESDGWEADDVIATMCNRWVGNKLLFVNDHDLFPLLDERTWIKLPHTEEIQTEFTSGHSSKELLDIFTLMGCTTDEVPGLPGVGEKRARDMIEACPNLVDLLLSDSPTEEIAPEIRAAILDNNSTVLKYAELALSNRDKVRLTRSLVELRNNVELKCTPGVRQIELAREWLINHDMDYQANKYY